MNKISYPLVTEDDQKEFFLCTMFPRERDAINRYFKMLDDRADSFPGESYNPGVLIKLSNAARYIFTGTVGEYKRHGFKDRLSAFENIIDRCSSAFLSLITTLDLGANNIPFELNVAGEIWDRIPENIGRLKNLRYLYLNGQPIEDLSPLAPLELNFLCLERCQVTDVSSLSFKRLGWLNLRETPIQNVSSIIGRGNSLGIIPLEHTRVNDPQQVLELTKLDSCSAIWLKECEVFQKLPDQFNFFTKNTENQSYEILDPLEKDRRSRLMSRPTHYMNVDFLDFN